MDLLNQELGFLKGNPVKGLERGNLSDEWLIGDMRIKRTTLEIFDKVTPAKRLANQGRITAWTVNGVIAGLSCNATAQQRMVKRFKEINKVGL